jgi:mannonate dehydratase
MKVLLRDRDLSEDYLRFASQIGCHGFDVMNAKNFPSVLDQGHVDLAEMVAVRRRLEEWGLEINCVMPPAPTRYLRGEAGGETEVEHHCRTVEALGRAGVKLVMIRAHLVEFGSNPGRTHARGRGVHRGGYGGFKFDQAAMRQELERRPADCVVDVEAHYDRSVRLFRRLAPIAGEFGTRLILHPSDPPLFDSEWSPQRWSEVVDAVNSPHFGLLYCIGTRYETGINIYDDIRAFGRRGAILHTHFRNVRGTIPSTGGYQEMALDDGDMNMFRVLQTLREVGFDGGLQVDHLPVFAADTPFAGIASAYSVAYIKGLLAALDAPPALASAPVASTPAGAGHR